MARLVISEQPNSPGLATEWLDRMVALGARVARYHRGVCGRQLVVALSVPKRDFTAVLIGCGWVLTSEAPKLPDPLAAFKGMKPGQHLRAVTSRYVIAETFSSLDEAADPPRVQFGGSTWRVDSIRAIAALRESDGPGKEPRPEPRSLERMAGLDRDWDARLALPAADLAIVGTRRWLEQEFDVYLAKDGDKFPPSSIESLLRPRSDKMATWFTRLFPAARLADHLPLPEDLNAVILDGNGAITYLGEIEAPVVICVLDRSVADETAGENIIQQRNTRGKPLSIAHDLRWSPPAGVEALAFTVPL